MEMGAERWLKTMEESIEENFNFDEGIEGYHQYLDAEVSSTEIPHNNLILDPLFIC